MPGAIPQRLKASASLGNFLPSPHYQSQDATGSLGLNLPQNAMRSLAHSQTLGMTFTRAAQPCGTTTVRRRSHKVACCNGEDALRTMVTLSAERAKIT